MASINDKITDTRNAARPNSARVVSTRAVGVTTLSCDALTGWPTDSAVHFVTYQIDSNNEVIAGTQTDWKGLVSGSSIGSLELVDGTDNGNSVGDVVEMLPTAGWGQDLADAITTEHDRSGAHTSDTITDRSADTNPANDDLVLTSDTSDSGALKKVALQNLMTNVGGLLGNIETYTSTDTWTKPTGLNFIIVEVVGGGGAGGGAAYSATATRVGGGGGAGGYSRSLLAAASLGATETVTVGAGGTGDQGDGDSGSGSSFGSHVTANGGAGGVMISAASQNNWGNGANGANAGTGDFTIGGGDGSSCQIDHENANQGVGGDGGDSFFGGGGRGEVCNGSGESGASYGAGGGGGANYTNAPAGNSGGSGGAGLVIVYEYY